eukprot:TRINITY_DN3133_c0_g1_i2.p4 TRINITY_DN3133_c0_g1~~TRINITY_DN3133_c0_g1_i2.p4  ORF type:complete len:115 (+),score=7.51 TRINITY_DN3133_c0_g1_i2:522-866(+)
MTVTGKLLRCLGVGLCNGISCSWRRMQKYSPTTAVTTTASTLMPHQIQDLGNPAQRQHSSKCTKKVVTAKSRHFLARSTISTRKPAQESDAIKYAEHTTHPYCPLRSRPSEEKS